MAFDPEHHIEHPETGVHLDKRTGFPAGFAPLPIKRVNDEVEYPKWVEPHPGHIKHHPVHGYPTAPEWGEMHMGRDGAIKVLAASAEEEARALADPDAPPEPTEAA